MAKVVYRDLDGACPKTSVLGVPFDDGKAVTTDDPAVLLAIKGNPWFEVSGASADKLSEGEDAAEAQAALGVPPVHPSQGLPETEAEPAPKRRGRPPKAAEAKGD